MFVDHDIATLSTIRNNADGCQFDILTTKSDKFCFLRLLHRLFAESFFPQTSPTCCPIQYKLKHLVWLIQEISKVKCASGNSELISWDMKPLGC